MCSPLLLSSSLPKCTVFITVLKNPQSPSLWENTKGLNANAVFVSTKVVQKSASIHSFSTSSLLISNNPSNITEEKEWERGHNIGNRFFYRSRSLPSTPLSINLRVLAIICTKKRPTYYFIYLVPSAISYIHIVHFETMLLRWPPHLLSV